MTVSPPFPAGSRDPAAPAVADIREWGRTMFGSYVRRRERELVGKEDRYRVVEPMEVGLELLLEDAPDGDPLDVLRAYSLHHCASSGPYFEVDGSTASYLFEGDRLSFDSPIVTETPANGRAEARVFEAGGRRRAVVVVPHWNAPDGAYDRFAWFLRRAGVTTLCLGLPYHGRRCLAGHRLATPMVSANLGLTIRSCRQAVLEARLAIDWLRRRGYDRIGVIGFSLGSAIASIAAAHDRRVTAAALILTAGQFGEAVWTGRATRHIRRSLEGRVDLEPLNDIWSIISPISFIGGLAERELPVLVVSAREDEVFLPYLTERFLGALRDRGVPLDARAFSCGHYTLGTLPFSALMVDAAVRFLGENL